MLPSLVRRAEDGVAKPFLEPRVVAELLNIVESYHLQSLFASIGSVLQIGNRIALPGRQFRAATHDLDIARVTEQPVAFPGGQLLDDAELLQMSERLVDRGRGDAGLLRQ